MSRSRRMTTTTRREFVADGATFGATMWAVLGGRSALGRDAKIKIGGCDWSMRKEGDPAAFQVAKEAGLDGVQVSCGRGKEKLPILEGNRLKRTLEASKETGLAVTSTCLEVLHRDGAKNHPDSSKWIEQAIEATRALGAKVILLPFFGKQAIEKREEQQAVADRLKPLAPLAEKAGVILGLENTISAEDNAWILGKVGSPAVKVYYDVGNSYSRKYDVTKEIVWLGKDRVCQLHLKDGGNLLGKGPIDFPKFIEAVLKSGFEGWALLETSVVTGNVAADFGANANYVRSLLK